MADANAFASVLGEGPDDVRTFFEARYTDDNGARYAVVSTLVNPDYPDRAAGLLVEPEWGADMVAAGRAQSKLVFYAPPDEPDEEPAPFASPDKLAAVVGFDVEGAINTFGLVRD